MTRKYFFLVLLASFIALPDSCYADDYVVHGDCVSGITSSGERELTIQLQVLPDATVNNLGDVYLRSESDDIQIRGTETETIGEYFFGVVDAGSYALSCDNCCPPPPVTDVTAP